MQYRILAVTIWSSIIGNLEFCTANDLANKYSGHLTEVKTFDPQKQILHPSFSRRLYYKNDTTLYPSTTEIITFEQDQLSDHYSSLDNVNFNHTTSKDNETNDTNIVDLASRISINDNHKSAPLSIANYEISVANSRFKETNDYSAFKIKNNVESTITSGTNERISEQVELNDEDKFLESEKNDFTRDNLPTASSSYGKFSGPIIVPDFPQLSTSSSTLMSENLADNKKDNSEIQNMIGSTLVLNPLRVGVALVNNQENIFIDDNSEKNQSVKCVASTSTMQTEANTLDEENAASNDESKSCSNINSNYEQFSKQSESREFDENSTNKKKPDDTVEIQKSIEIYHNAPVQEIHYPFELSLPLSPHVENIFQKAKVNEPINYDARKELRIDQLQDQPIDVQSGNSNVYVGNFYDNVEENLSRSRQINNLVIGNTDGVQKSINFPYISMGLYLSSDKRVDANSFPAQQSNNNNGNNIGIPIFLLPGQSQDTTTNYEQYSDGGNIFNGASITTSDKTSENKHQLNNLKSNKDSSHHYVENQHEERSDPSLNQYHLFQRILQNNPFIETRYVVPVSSPYSIIAKKSIEKPAYGTHTTELENLDNKVFYSIEKLTDKQTSSTQQLVQVHPQIPNDKQAIEKQTRLPDPYTFYIEKTEEKKVPHVIHRLIMQPYPVNIKLPSISSEKIIPDYSEKKVVKHNHKPYLIEIGKHPENIKVHTEDIDKLVSQPSQVHRSLQKFYAEVTSIPFHRNYINSSSYSSSIHNLRKKPNFHFEDNISGYNNNNNNNKNVHFNYLEQSSNSVPPKEIISNGNLRSYRRRAKIFDNKDRTPKNKYIDSRQTSSSSLRMQLKSSPFFLLEAQQSIVPGIMRNARQSEGYPLGDIGNFRQSKVEYGFKPPMIPSIQYDEQTATKIDN